MPHYEAALWMAYLWPEPDQPAGEDDAGDLFGRMTEIGD